MKILQDKQEISDQDIITALTEQGSSAKFKTDNGREIILTIKYPLKKLAESGRMLKLSYPKINKK